VEGFNKKAVDQPLFCLVPLGGRKRNGSPEHVEVALNGLGAGAVNVHELDTHALAGHVSDLRFDEHDSLLKGQAGHQFDLVPSLERCGLFASDEHTSYAEIADVLDAFESPDDDIKVKLDPRSQSFVFLRVQAL